LLVLGNKNDIDGHTSVKELISALDLPKIQGRAVSVSTPNLMSPDAPLTWRLR